MGGVDKLTVPLDGRSCLERLLGDVEPQIQVFAVGPARATMRPVRWCSERPPGGGPVAAIAAALPLTSAGVVLIAAGDMPFLGSALTLLGDTLSGTPEAEVAILCDGDGMPQPLAAAYRRTVLAQQLITIGDPEGQAARRLLENLVVVEVTAGHAATDCDTWDDVARINEDLRTSKAP